MFVQRLRYKNALRLLFTLLLGLIVYFLFSKQNGYFLFNADHESLRVWYPHYYRVVYYSILFFKAASCIALIFSLWKLRYLWYEAQNLLKDLLAYARKLPGETEKIYTCRNAGYFFAGQLTLLALALVIYFYLNPGHEAFQAQLYMSRIYIFTALLGVILFAAANHDYFVSAILKFLFTPSAPYNLAGYRVLFFLVMILIYSGNFTDGIQYIDSKPREALPFIGWLIDFMPLNKELYYYACIAGLTCCVFLVFGLFTRFFLFLNAVLVFYIIASPNFYGKLWHSQLPIWISWFLLFAPVSEVFSLDRLFFKGRGTSLRAIAKQSVIFLRDCFGPRKAGHAMTGTRNDGNLLYKSPNFTFPIKIAWLQMGFIYFWSGFYKLWDVGFEWALGETMPNQVHLEWFEHFNKIPVMRIDKFPEMLHLGGLLVILFELCFLFMLYHRHLKYISIIGGLFMHNMAGIFMYIAFPGLQIQYIVFIYYEGFLKKLKNLFPSFPYRPDITLTHTEINKKMVALSMIVLGMNIIFGINKISSFPFSVYPTYSEHVGSEKEYLHYEIKNPELTNVIVWELGKKSNFRWENFTRLEYSIIRNYHKTGLIDTAAIYNQWAWWTNEIDILKSADSVDVYSYKRSLNPDSANVILNKEFLLKIYPLAKK